MKKVLLTRPFPQKAIDAARARFDITVRDRTDGLTEDDAAKALTEYDGILLTLGDAFNANAFICESRAKVLASFGFITTLT